MVAAWNSEGISSLPIMIEANIIKVIKVANYNHLQCQRRFYIFQRINYFPIC